MNSKKSKVNKIKLCLKKGIPVAVIAAGVVAAANGCEDNSSKQPVSQPKPTPVSFEACHNVELNVVATLKLDNSHFSKDLTKLSEAGNKKLNDFTMQLAEIGETIPRYYIAYKIDIDFSEKNAKRKRKKVQAVFDKYSSYWCRSAGLPSPPMPPDESIKRTIASILHLELYKIKTRNQR